MDTKFLLCASSRGIELGKIKSTILGFYEPIKSDENHRYRSWEHCYRYFAKTISENDIEHACLHLAFYLASWGMYRGSSDLLQKDYLIHKGVVKEIIAYRHLFGTRFENQDEAVSAILKLIGSIRKHYQNALFNVDGKKRDKPFNATDTLVTKILLGTLGCVPAYDQYFVQGMRAKGIGYSKLSKENLDKVIQFYLDNQDEIDQAGEIILKSSGIKYPPMKLVDMHFWMLGNPNQRK